MIQPLWPVSSTFRLSNSAKTSNPNLKLLKSHARRPCSLCVRQTPLKSGGYQLAPEDRFTPDGAPTSVREVRTRQRVLFCRHAASLAISFWKFLKALDVVTAARFREGDTTFGLNWPIAVVVFWGASCFLRLSSTH